MAMPSRAPTVTDVARVANVSTATVSRALSRPELLAQRTLQRVRRAIAHLGFEPMAAAAHLSSGRHGRLGVLVTVGPDPESLALAAMCVNAAQAHGRGAALHFVPAPGPSRDRYLRDVNRLHSLDGLLDVDVQLSAKEIRVAGHTESTVISAADDPEVGFLAGRRLSSVLALSPADVVVAVGQARRVMLARLSGLAELVPNVIVRWHDGTFSDAHRVFTDRVAAQAARVPEARTVYVALDAVAAGAGMLALAHRPVSVLPLICAVTHPLSGVHDVVTLRAFTMTAASRVVDQLIEQIDNPAPSHQRQLLYAAATVSGAP